MKQIMMVDVVLLVERRERELSKGGKMRRVVSENAGPPDVIITVIVQDGRTGELDPAHNRKYQHEPGRHARRALEAARESIAALLGAQTTGRETDTLIFTSGGTESNNLALTGLMLLDNVKPPRPTLVGAIRSLCFLANS